MRAAIRCKNERTFPFLGLFEIILTGARGCPSLRRQLMAAKFKRRTFLIYFACLALLGLLGWLDYVTGYELGFFVFYSVPVGIAAWKLGRWPAVGMSLVASLAWALADSYGGARYSSRFALYWNNGIHFASFIINAVAIARIKTELDRRHQLDAELDAARKALRAVAGQLPACPVCGQAHNRTPNAGEGFRLSQPPPELADALCTPCRGLSSESE
jgi:hypothetical protein